MKTGQFTHEAMPVQSRKAPFIRTTFLSPIKLLCKYIKLVSYPICRHKHIFGQQKSFHFNLNLYYSVFLNLKNQYSDLWVSCHGCTSWCVCVSTCARQRTTCRKWFSPPTTWIPRLEPRSIVLAASSFSHWITHRPRTLKVMFTCSHTATFILCACARMHPLTKNR